MADYNLGTAHGKITLDYNGDRAVARAEDDIDRLQRKSATSDKSLARLGKTLKGLGKGVAIGGLVTSLSIGAIQAAAMTTQILGMIPALASISSLAALIPASFVGAAASVGVLKAALSGVGDALKEAFNTESVEKFNKALEKLSPNARRFAIAFRQSAPALRAVQQGIQDAFFGNNFEELLPRLVNGLNSIRPALNGLASDFGRVGKRVAAFFVDSDISWEFLENVILQVRRTIISLEPTLKPILVGLREIGSVGLSFFPRITAAVVELARNFGQWLNYIAESGQLEDWINTAIATLSTLGGIVQNVFSIMSALISAAQAEGGGLLNTILELTEGLSAWLGTAEGAAAVGGFFSSIMAVARQLVPLFTTLATALLQAVGPAMMVVAQELGPVLLQVIEALAPAFAPLATAIVDLATAIAPLLPPLAQLVALIATGLATALSSLGVALGPSIELLGGTFATAIQTLAPLLASLAEEAFPLAESLGTQLLQALLPLLPVILQVAQAFATALAPSIPDIVQAMTALTPSIVDLAKAFTDFAIFGLQAIIPFIPVITDLLVLLSTAGIPATQVVLTLAAAFTRFNQIAIGAMLGLFQEVAKLPGIIGGAFSSAWAFVSDIGGQIGDFFAGLPGVIGGALSSLGTTIGSAFSSIGTFFAGVGAAIGNFITSIPGRIAALPGQILTILSNMLKNWATMIGFVAGLVVGIFTKLPGRIAQALVNLASLLSQKAQEAWAALKAMFQTGVDNATSTATSLLSRIRTALVNLPGQIAGIATNAWNAVVRAFNTGVNNAVTFVRLLLSRARAVLSALPGQLATLASNAWNRLKNAFNTGVNSAVALARDLPGKIRSALGNLATLLLQSGRNIINGLIDGISGGISRVMDMVRGLADRVKGAFNSALEIFSPSRAFRWSGEMIGEGLIVGIGRKLSQVRAMAKTLADNVIAPTVSLPSAVAPVTRTAAYANPYRNTADPASGGRNFGPYKMLLDGKVVSEFVIDTITGNPKTVKKSSDEGARQAAFA